MTAIEDRNLVRDAVLPEPLHERLREVDGKRQIVPGVNQQGLERLALPQTVQIRLRTDGTPQRPEKLELFPLEAGPPGARPSVEGVIESSLYLGTATQVVVKLGDGTAKTVLVPNTDEAARQLVPGAGAAVRLAWANEHMHMVRHSEGGERAPAPRDTAEVA